MTEQECDAVVRQAAALVDGFFLRCNLSPEEAISVRASLAAALVYRVGEADVEAAIAVILAILRLLSTGEQISVSPECSRTALVDQAMALLRDEGATPMETASGQ